MCVLVCTKYRTDKPLNTLNHILAGLRRQRVLPIFYRHTIAIDHNLLVRNASSAAQREVVSKAALNHLEVLPYVFIGMLQIPWNCISFQPWDQLRNEKPFVISPLLICRCKLQFVAHNMSSYCQSVRTYG